MVRENAELVFESTAENQEEISSEKVTIGGLKAVLERQQERCALSGEVLTPESSALDHSLPLSRGGEHVLSNVQIVTPSINRMKGAMTTDEFVAACRRVVEWNR
jgi:hypothetical protein